MTRKGTDAPSVLNRFRAAFYLFLSRAFSREPDRETLDGLEQVSGGLMEAWALMELPSDADVQEGATLLGTFFSGLRQGGPVDRAVAQLAREYASLFLGVGPNTVPLCESAYTSASGLLYQSALFDVRRSYREAGLIKNGAYLEPDDHLAVELGCMAQLCEMAHGAATSGSGQALDALGLQQAFLEAHLSRWVPLFSQHLIAGAPSGFYRAMGHLVKGYIRIDGRLIDSMEREPSPSREPGTKEVGRKAHSGGRSTRL